MITTVLFLATICFILMWVKGNWDVEFIGIIGSLITAIMLLIAFVSLLMKSYNYGVLESKRSAFVETLKEARKAENSLELAAITKEIVSFNVELKEYQYTNSTILDEFVDDRVDELKPIK